MGFFKYDHPHNIKCRHLKTRGGRKYLKPEEMNAEHNLTNNFAITF